MSYRLSRQSSEYTTCITTHVAPCRPASSVSPESFATTCMNGFYCFWYVSHARYGRVGSGRFPNFDRLLWSFFVQTAPSTEKPARCYTPEIASTLPGVPL